MSDNNLLKMGYFPKELAGLFSTDSFSTYYSANINRFVDSYNDYSSKYTQFYIPKIKNFSRMVSIPNPINQAVLVNYILKTWKEINELYSISDFSFSIPVFSTTDNRAISTKKNYTDFIYEKAINSAGSTYCLNTDISRFYQTIYTHSIPWAIEGKTAAKKNKSPSSIGNMLDLLLRNMNDKQTLGIPTGPDTSRIISEIILCDIDKQLNDIVPDIKVLRYVDDYTIYTKTQSQAVEVLNELVSILKSYELEINEQKTEISKLPQEFEPIWQNTLRLQKIRNGVSEQKQDLLNYFSLAYNLYNIYPNKNVLHMAFIDKVGLKIYPENWSLYESLLLQCIQYEPRTIPIVGRILKTYKSLDYNLNTEIIHSCLLDGFRRQSKRFDCYSLSWSIFILCELGIEIHIDEMMLQSINDPILMTTILYAREKGNYKGKIPKEKWQEYFVEDSFQNEYWIFAYESSYHNWIKHKKGKNIIESTDDFLDLKNKSVSFIDLHAGLKEIKKELLDYEDISTTKTNEILYGSDDLASFNLEDSPF